MAASRASEELTDMVTCTICYETFEGRDPRSLPCLHAFCSKCIQDCLDAKQQQIGSIVTELACPICQTTATIPRGSAANLPVYFPCVQIQSVIEQLKEKHSICKVCESTTHKTEVVSYCFQCTTAMCSSCREKHDRTRGDHTVTMVTTSTILNCVCSEHDKYVDSYCIDCHQPVCIRCQIGSHCDHRINNFTCDIDERLEDLDCTLSSCTESADITLMTLFNMQSEFRKHMNHALEALDQHHADTIQQLTQQHETFRVQLQHRLDQENQEMDKLMIKMKEHYQRLEQLKSEVESLILPLSEVPDIRLVCTDDVIAAIKQQIPTVDVACQTRRLVFVPCVGTVSLGRIAKEVDEVEIEQPLGTDDSRLSTTSSREPELLWSVDCAHRNLDFLPDGDLIASNGAFGLRVYDHTSGLQRNHGLSTMCEGYIADISVNTARSIVAILHYKDLFGPGNFVVAQTNGMSRQIHPVCKGACSLACTQSGDYIVGSKHRILYKYSSEYHQIWEKKLSECPHHIIVDHQDRIIVRVRYQIVVFNEDGEELFAFPTSKDRRKLDPYGICVDSKDNILVSDMSNQSVLLYDNRGNFLRRIMQIHGCAMAVGLYMDKYMCLKVWHEGSDNKLCMYQISL